MSIYIILFHCCYSYAACTCLWVDKISGVSDSWQGTVSIVQPCIFHTKSHERTVKHAIPSRNCSEYAFFHPSLYNIRCMLPVNTISDPSCTCNGHGRKTSNANGVCDSCPCREHWKTRVAVTLLIESLRPSNSYMRQKIRACPAPSHYLNQCSLIAKWALRKKPH